MSELEGGEWRGVLLGRVSSVISEISTKSRSRIFLATLGGSNPAGLYGPLEWKPGTRPGSVDPVAVADADATEARSCRPVLLPLAVLAQDAGVMAGEKIGREGGRPTAVPVSEEYG